MSRYKQKSVWKGVLAGAVGGLAGTVIMGAFQKLALEGTRKAEDLQGGDHTYTRQQQAQMEGYKEAHMQSVEAIAAATGASLTEHQKQVAAPTEHFLFGTVCGAAYGLLAEFWHPATFGFGTAFGISLFLGASEGVLPAIGLAPSPLDTPPLLHAGGLAAHAVYGSATEGVRRLTRKAF